MLSLHFNKQVFINALKANKNMVTYLSTTIALMVIMIMHGLIQGNLKAEYFLTLSSYHLPFIYGQSSIKNSERPHSQLTSKQVDD